jgi:hypothetical protein
VKYVCKKECSWKGFVAKPGQEFEVKDLVADGKPLPKDVVETLVRTKGLAVVVEEPAQPTE